MTPTKQRHIIISITLSALTLFFAYLYFSPTPQKKKPITLQQENKPAINYDLIITELLKDTSSIFRKTLDSIYKEPQRKVTKTNNIELVNPVQKKIPSKPIKEKPKKISQKQISDTVKPKPN